VRAVKGSGLNFFEQPVAADNLSGMAQVAVETDIEVGADEGIHSLEDIKRHRERNAARGVSLKAIKLGGITALFEAGRLCAQLNMSVNISCKTGESSIACHRIACRLCPSGHRLGAHAHAYRIGRGHFGAPVPTANGHVDVLKRPGLGVEVDEDRLRRYSITVVSQRLAASITR
jgi:L-alanine-DL-glutamate epimerase-like enolase superfamily enzyme